MLEPTTISFSHRLPIRLNTSRLISRFFMNRLMRTIMSSATGSLFPHLGVLMQNWRVRSFPSQLECSNDDPPPNWRPALLPCLPSTGQSPTVYRPPCRKVPVPCPGLCHFSSVLIVVDNRSKQQLSQPTPQPSFSCG